MADSNEQTPPRIGLSMRVAAETRYEELRDAIAADWCAFMEFALPDALWLPLPNVGAGAAKLVDAWGLDGIVLTGGNDLGEYAHKDETDAALLRHAMERGLPLFGVCRGLQVIAHAHGLALEGCDPHRHVAAEHPIEFRPGALGDVISATHATVNSYHQFGLRHSIAAESLEIQATEGPWAEAVSVRGLPITAVMWHPERGRPFRDMDRRIVRHTFRTLLP